MLADTPYRSAEMYWAGAHRNPTWLSTYRASSTAPWRQPMLTALRLMAPLTTVLDLGCNCGALMPLIRTVTHDVKVTGVDVNPAAIVMASEMYPTDTWVCASVLDWLPMCHERFDVVTSGTMLAHIAPEDIDAVLVALTAVVDKAIVLQEPTATACFPESRIAACGVPQWRYAWPQRLGALGWSITHAAWNAVGDGAVMIFERGR